ncbi:MAG: prepilin-type N-terminal cleavage/methylation domain-containing protein [Candidatus Sumerlaeia bacterium]|nr:prepilin-type N-terminal cleavage/methylation domain-containing protein [Candidatus Sumerlaeia bacterium]
MRNLSRTSRGFTMLEIMIVVGIIGIVIAIALPGWFRQRQLSQQQICQENLTKIDGAKEQWALENKMGPSATPTDAELYGMDLYLRSAPNCPSGGAYTIGDLQTRPTCSQSSNADFPHVFPDI